MNESDKAMAMSPRELVNHITAAIENKAACFMACDDYLVSAQLAQVGRYKIQVAVYVDNYIRGRDIEIADSVEQLGEVARRFRRHRKIYAWSSAQVARAEKALGKRTAREMGFTRDSCQISTNPFFTTARAAARHLVKYNPRIELLDRDDYHARLRRRSEAVA